MNTPTLRLVHVGSARVLTQDGEAGPYLELMVISSRTAG